MKNVKFGFQFGLGFYLAKCIWSIPSAMNDPRVKRDIERIKKVFQTASEDRVTNETESETTKNHVEGAFPACKNIIGFAAKE